MNGGATFVWDPLLPPLGLLALGATVALSFLLVARRGRTLPRTSWVGLLGLRVLGLGALLWVAGGPAMEERSPRARRVPLAVLLDTSRSMDVLEGGHGRRDRVSRWWKEHAPGFAALGAEVEVLPFRFDQRLEAWSTATEPWPLDGRGTDLGAAILTLREALGGRPAAGVLVVSDGADRGTLGRIFEEEGETGVRRALAGLRAPISTWTVSGGDSLRDLRIDVPSPPPFGFVRRPVLVDAVVIDRADPGGHVPVQVVIEGEPRAPEVVELDAEGEGHLQVSFRPDRVGPHTVTLRVPDLDDDAVPGNNDIDVTVEVVRDRTRVLQVTSRPTWDVKALRGLLKADPNLDLVSFFILRSELRRAPLVASGSELSLIPFPADDLFGPDLLGFDLVILQNFAFRSVPDLPAERYADQLLSYVREGGALLLVGGDVAFGEGDWPRTSLRELLPAEALPQRPGGSSFRAALTDAGRRHPVTRLLTETAANDARWAELPALQGWNPLGALADGAVELLRAGPEGPPLLAVRQVGRGRVLALATDSSWRWAMRGAGLDGADDHAIFWRNTIRWLVRDIEEQQVTLSLDRENLPLGESAVAQVRVLRDDWSPRAGAMVTGSVRAMGAPDGTRIEGRTDGDGLWTTRLTAEKPGTLRVEVQAPDVPAPFDRAVARLSVVDRDPELLDPRPRPELLRAVSDATGGRAWVGAGPVPPEIPLRELPRPEGEDRRRHPLWDHPLALLAVVVPWSVEWILRRRLGAR